MAFSILGKAHDETKPPRFRRGRRKLRKLVVVSGLGAAAAYFLDRQNGQERRDRARRRTSSSARHLGHGLESAAKVAHETADLSETPEPSHAGAAP